MKTAQKTEQKPEQKIEQGAEAQKNKFTHEEEKVYRELVKRTSDFVSATIIRKLAAMPMDSDKDFLRAVRVAAGLPAKP